MVDGVVLRMRRDPTCGEKLVELPPERARYILISESTLCYHTYRIED